MNKRPFCRHCGNQLARVNGKIVFRTLPDGRIVHVGCEEGALGDMRLLTAQPSQLGRYRE